MLFYLSRLINILPGYVFFGLIFFIPLFTCFVVQTLIAKKILRLSLSLFQILLLTFCSMCIYFSLVILSISGYGDQFFKIIELYAQTIFEMSFALFGQSYMSPIVGYFLMYFPVVYVMTYMFLWKVKSTSARKIKATLSVQSFILSGLGGLFSVAIGFGTAIGILEWQNLCQRYTLDIFHEFNAHVKNLCAGDDRTQCPRNEEALKAFNPEKYVQLEKCSNPSYSFDENTQTYSWQVPFSGDILQGSSENQYHYGRSREE